MGELYRIDNTEQAGALRSKRRWVTPEDLFDVGGGYVLRVFFQPLEPDAVPKAVLQNRNGLVFHDDLLPGSYADIARWTGLIIIPRATELNTHGGPKRMLIEFAAVKQGVQLA